MSKRERIAALEAEVEHLKARLALLEARGPVEIVPYPVPSYPPQSPFWQVPTVAPWPGPYVPTITCDGTAVNRNAHASGLGAWGGLQ